LAFVKRNRWIGHPAASAQTPRKWRLKIFPDDAYFRVPNVDEQPARSVIGLNEYGLH
jgi:hypothetical protein